MELIQLLVLSTFVLRVLMNQRLSELSLLSEYRSDRNNLVVDFYDPCLQRSDLYRRAVGYFSSRGLAVAAQGIAQLIQNGGQMRLVASPRLDPEDLTAIRSGYEAREDVVARALLRVFDAPDDRTDLDRIGFLAWLVADRRLEIRIAIPIGDDAQIRRGIYHEKLGLFSDLNGNMIAFTGSPNETGGGLIDNFETIDVFCSWDDPQSRVSRKLHNFEDLWSNKTRGLEIIEFPEAVRRRLLDFVSAPPSDHTGDGTSLNRWRHQDEAVSTFLGRERGVLEMATGTGKTRTALRICEILASTNQVETIVVSTDGNDLLDQWSAQLLDLVTILPQRYRVVRHYGAFNDRDRFELDPRLTVLLISRSALAPALRALSITIAKKTILVHDEVHRLGSPANRAALSGLTENIRFRLGLSATPEREYDAEGTEFILQTIGPTIYQFGLADAIRRGILAPFNYYPLEYVPDENDKRRLQEVYRRAEARRLAGDPMSREEIWIDLAKVHKTSLAKLPIFASFIERHPELLERCIIFVETQDYGHEVLKIVHQHRHDFHTYFTGEESDTLRRFARGDIQCMLTCHRLSEGIDIKSIMTVVLFSSSRSRLETIQRMGRCLRSDALQPDKRANIVDFVRVDENGIRTTQEERPDDLRRTWLEEMSLIKPEE